MPTASAAFDSFILDPPPAEIPAVPAAFLSAIEDCRGAMLSPRASGCDPVAMFKLAEARVLSRWGKLNAAGRAKVMAVVEVVECYPFSRRFPDRNRFFRAVSACAFGDNLRVA